MSADAKNGADYRDFAGGALAGVAKAKVALWLFCRAAKNRHTSCASACAV
jgi:hypothetical protein